MPIFEYRCQRCGKVFELLQKADGLAKQVCPVCSSDELKKVPSSFAVGHGQNRASQCPTCTFGQQDLCCGGTCPMSG